MRLSGRSLCGVALTLALLTSVASCGAPTVPSPPPPAGPEITCPPAIAILVLEAPVAVHYPAPTVTGGTAPVATTCTAASGSLFPSGMTNVACTAIDSLQRSSECRLSVTVSIAPRLEATRFLAIGDSITEGQVSLLARFPRALESENSYPSVLQTLLRSHYSLQAADIEVVNAGLGSRKATDDEDRIYDEIDRYRPDALLLLHGANDVNAAISPETIAASLRADVRRAFRLGVKKVFLSTLLPQIEGRSHSVHPELVEPLNESIRYMAMDEGAVLVDAFATFAPQTDILIGVDGLHPTRQGYKVLAELFLSAIQQHFALSPPPQHVLADSHRSVRSQRSEGLP